VKTERSKHNGFDFAAMKAFKIMRVAESLGVHHNRLLKCFVAGRSYLRKGLEAYFTVLEVIWGKSASWKCI
jgi:hypothetical protein